MKYTFLVTLLILVSCGQDNPTKITSEKNIYHAEKTNNIEELKNAINNASEEINKLSDEKTLNNFPEELLGVWQYSCEDVNLLKFEKINNTYKIFGMEWSGEIYDITKNNNNFRIKYTRHISGEPDIDDLMDFKFSNGELTLENDSPMKKCN